VSLTIEDMRAEHVDAVAALEAAAFPAREAAGGPSYADRLREELVRPWTRLWIARSDDAGVLGFLLAWHVVDELHILDVAAALSHRRQGVGRALMTHAIAWASEHRARQMLLEVRRSNTPAIRLYRTLGFFGFGLRRDYYADHEDALEMMLLLDPETGNVVTHADEVTLEEG
jgi:ribosomal-protein-alanine N-acetyltransferase